MRRVTAAACAECSQQRRHMVSALNAQAFVFELWENGF